MSLTLELKPEVENALREYAAEDARLTDAERQANRQFWEDFNRRERVPVQI